MGWVRGKLGEPCALLVHHSGPRRVTKFSTLRLSCHCSLHGADFAERLVSFPDCRFRISSLVGNQLRTATFVNARAVLPDRRADNFQVARQFQTSFKIAAAPELNFGNFERPPARQRVLACAQALVANVCSSRASQHSTFCFFSTPGTFK
jgi:hypothetical protein